MWPKIENDINLFLQFKIPNTNIISPSIAHFTFIKIKLLTSLSTRFTTGSTGLYAQYFTSVLKSWDAVLGPSGEVNVDGSSHASAKIGWARVDITELLGQLEVFAGFSLD